MKQLRRRHNVQEPLDDVYKSLNGYTKFKGVKRQKGNSWASARYGKILKAPT